jgi:hypothetical protein
MTESFENNANGNKFWIMSLPLKHRELVEQKPEVIMQDRQILYAYLREKLMVTEHTCDLNTFDIPDFKALAMNCWYALFLIFLNLL